MSLVEIIKHYQRSIVKCQGDLERTLHCVKKLYNLPITVKHLQDTGIGRTVNALRKYEGDCGDAAKACVSKWKEMVVAEDSSEAETEEQKPEDPDSRYTPPNTPDPDENTSRRRREVECRSRGTRSSSNDSPEKKSSSKRETSTNKVRDKLREETVKRHKDHVSLSSARSSSGDDRPANNSNSETEELRQKVNGSSKHKKSSHSSSRSVSSDNNRKHESSKSQEDLGPKKDRHEERKKSSKSEELSGKKRHEESKAKERDRSKTSTESSETRKQAETSTARSPHNGSRHREREKRKEDKGAKDIQTEDGSIDCLSGASFAEALGMVNPKRRSSPSSRSPSKPSKSASPVKSSRSGTGAGSSRTPAVSSPADFDFLSSSAHLEPLDTELTASMELPPITPHYRPLPNAYNPYDSPPSKKMKTIADGEALAQLMYHKAERTKVYSGVKGCRRGEPSSLFDSCIRVLQDNIDALGYTGGVPYSILKPVLERATPEQLLELEHFNPYLVEDTDELWEFHVKKQFRTMGRQEMETYRELFLRGLDERAAKLEALTSNIKHSQAMSVPVRKAKMTYMDSVAKPPREVARQQARNGTAAPLSRVNISASSSGSAAVKPFAVAKQKPRVAPLMQKAMKFAKTYKR